MKTYLAWLEVKAMHFKTKVRLKFILIRLAKINQISYLIMGSVNKNMGKSLDYLGWYNVPITYKVITKNIDKL